jgi:hypothetical protein
MSEKGKVKYRSVGMDYLLGLVTLGIYPIYWYIATKDEINSLGGNVPTGFLLFVPIINFYWMYKYCEGFSNYVAKDNNPAKWFLITFFAGFLNPFLMQPEYNKYAEHHEQLEEKAAA